MQAVPEIDIKQLVDYASQRGVGIILWAGYYAFAKDIEGLCRHYAQLGVKGFKIDFMDSDNQHTISFLDHAAEIAARYHLLLDYHGICKPAGQCRTWPNVINFEAVYGLENAKWTKPEEFRQEHRMCGLSGIGHGSYLEDYGRRLPRIYPRRRQGQRLLPAAQALDSLWLQIMDDQIAVA